MSTSESKSKKTNLLKTNKSRNLTFSKDYLLDLYKKMYLIRTFENACGEQYSLGNIRGFLHLYIGQEATGVGVISQLYKDDYIITHYRDHGHALARGLDVNRCMAELFGKVTGLSKGKGGSMHLFDASRNFMGGHAIVGGQLPVSAGLALAQKYKKTDGITVCFFGDGATNQGVYHETLNLASIWKLPILFILENNGYGMGSSIERVRAGGVDFFPGVSTYDIESTEVDGMDVLAVVESVSNAIDKIRTNSEPYFIECKTFRYVGHSYADGQKYRGNSEIEMWKKRDPIITFPKYMNKNGINENQIRKVKSDVEKIIQKAVEFSLSSEDPPDNELYTDIFID